MASRPPPNLSDPVELTAYRQELRGVARGVRSGGVLLAVLGAIAAAVRAWALPTIPALVPLVIVALAALLMLTGIALRTAYHVRRMKRDDA
jgi:uncharacterized membrane protein